MKMKFLGAFALAGLANELSRTDQIEEGQNMLTSYGGYSEVVEKTVRFYIEKTGEWKLKGEDQYCQDAQKVADRLLKKQYSNIR